MGGGSKKVNQRKVTRFHSKGGDMTGKTLELIIKAIDLAIEIGIRLVGKIKGRKGNGIKGTSKAR